jgi:hypothetical protein
MSDARRPIDDPEVREQHRRQARRQLRRCAGGVVIGVAFLLGPAILETATDAAFGTRVPATVESVDADDGSVTVTSEDSRVADYSTFDVHDTDAYSEGDHVGVVLTGEEQNPTGLDREPILPQMIPPAMAFGALTFVGIAIGTVVVAWLTLRRRRALRRPWQRVHVALFAEGAKRYAHLPDERGGTYWRLSDLDAELPTRAALDAQVAGSTRRLVVRFFGSTQLGVGRRRRARSRWTELLPVPERQPTGESAISEPRCTSVGVSAPRSSSSCLASRK